MVRARGVPLLLCLGAAAGLTGCMTLPQYEMQIQDQRASMQTSKCIQTGEEIHASGVTSDLVDWNLARCYFRAGKYEDAIRTASRIRREFSDMHAVTAACYAELGDATRAVEEFERAAKGGYLERDETLRPSLIRALGATGQRGLVATASYVVNRNGDFSADLKIFEGLQRRQASVPLLDVIQHWTVPGVIAQP